MSIRSLNSGIFKMQPLNAPQELQLKPTDENKPEDTPVSDSKVDTANEVTEAQKKGLYETEYNLAKKRLDSMIDRAPSPIQNPQDACSYTVTFKVYGTCYSLTAKPTYYKGTDGEYYLHNTTENAMKSMEGVQKHVEYTVEQTSSNRNIGLIQSNPGGANIECPGDEPKNWMKDFGHSGHVIQQEDGSYKEVGGDYARLYDKEQLASHLPQDIIDQFFVQDSTHPDGYKLADNVKSIELASNDAPDYKPKYKITYIGDDGREKEITFVVAEINKADGTQAPNAISVNVVDTAQRSEYQAIAKNMFARLASHKGYNI